MFENRFQSKTTDTQPVKLNLCVCMCVWVAVGGCSNVAPNVALTHFAFASFSASRHHCFLVGFLCIQTSSVQARSLFMFPPTLMLWHPSADQGYSTQWGAFLLFFLSQVKLIQARLPLSSSYLLGTKLVLITCFSNELFVSIEENAASVRESQKVKGRKEAKPTRNFISVNGLNELWWPTTWHAWFARTCKKEPKLIF